MPSRVVRRANAFFDERLGSQHFLKDALGHIFPDNWSFMLGEMAMYCFILLVLSGIYLALFFVPSDSSVVYHGPYMPMHGVSMPEAYQSMLNIDLEVRAGNFFRQVHHYAALLFLGSLSLHMMRIFFTGAYRKPRDINWMIGLTLMTLAVLNGFTGYSLPGDLLSGLGLRIAYTIAMSIPVLGPWMASLFFGGNFPSDGFEHRLYVAHVFIVPLLIAALLGIHLALIWRQKHTAFPGRGRSEKRLVGSQMWPMYTFRSMALMCFTYGVISLLSGLAQVNPVWLYGPYQPDQASIFAQPDWYVGWLIGALRLWPGWRLHLWGYTVAEVFWPGVLFPLLLLVLLYLVPAIDRYFTGDMFSHNLLERPRDRPVRTALGAGVLSFYLILFAAGAQDVFSYWLKVPITSVMMAMRGMTLVVPPITAVITWKLCRDLSAQSRLLPTEPPRGGKMGASPPSSRYVLPRTVRHQGDRPWEETT